MHKLNHIHLNEKKGEITVQQHEQVFQKLQKKCVAVSYLRHPAKKFSIYPPLSSVWCFQKLVSNLKSHS